MEFKNNTLYAAAEIFIIPNRALRFEDLVFKDRITKMARDNGINLDPEEKIIQTWMCSVEELACDNINDHFGHFMVDGERYSIDHLNGMVPYNLLKDCKEGDEITIKFKDVECFARRKGEESFRINVELKLTCNQLDYRYRNFGCFEEALNSVL